MLLIFLLLLQTADLFGRVLLFTLFFLFVNDSYAFSLVALSFRAEDAEGAENKTRLRE